MKSVVASLVVVGLAISNVVSARPGAQAPAFRIVVVEGEDAVNIVQQKTAVRPLVEVRDRNDLPVAGAVVQFTIQATAGAARSASFANGQNVVSVTTNAAGRASSTALEAVGTGPVRIQVQATYQGQMAATTVTQTNFATVNAANAAGRTPSPQAAGGAAGTGGMVGTLVGVAAAGVSGALAVRQGTREDCSVLADAFTLDLASVRQSCVNAPANSPSCQQSGSQAAESLSRWCSCAGRVGVESQLAKTGTTLDRLLQAANAASLAVSCR